MTILYTNYAYNKRYLPFFSADYLNSELELVSAEQAALVLKAKPGLTGLWQILGRNEIDFENRLLLDEFYVRNWDFLLDLELLLRTPAVLGRGL